MAKSNISMALVLEDDVAVLPGLTHDSFFKQLEVSISNLEHVQGDDWDLLWLRWRDKTMEKSMGVVDKIILPETPTDPGLKKAGCYGTTAAYVISRHGVQKILALQ